MKYPVDISEIVDANWQLSNREFGQVAIGAEDLLMCVHNILFTRKGELPLDQQAGSNLYKLVDKPLNIVTPGVVAEVIDAVNTQEPRLKVSTVIPVFQAATGGVEYQISLTVVATNKFLGYVLNLSAPKNGLRSFSDEFTSDFG